MGCRKLSRLCTNLADYILTLDERKILTWGEKLLTFGENQEVITFSRQTGKKKIQTYRADYLNAVYFRRGLTCTLGLANDLIDGGQPRAKPKTPST